MYIAIVTLENQIENDFQFFLGKAKMALVIYEIIRNKRNGIGYRKLLVIEG